MEQATPPSGPISRRAAIAAAAALLAAPRLAIGRDDDSEIARVKQHARMARLGEFGVSKNDQYLAIGDADEKFRKRALEILTKISGDYLEHFKTKGFAVKKPSGRMTVIMLADRAAFTRFLGEDVPGLVGGVYNPDSNDLAIFDNRAAAANLEAEKDNTLVLTHEAIHQLTFNTGLLHRGGDIPKVVTEGLANYCELRSPNGKDVKIGGLNHRRLISLPRPTPGRGSPMAPVEQLIRDDTRIESRETEQVAYSEAWVLVHYLMKNPRILPKFREYLAAIAGRKDAKSRLEDWSKHLGDPAATDRALVQYLADLWAERGRR